MSTADAQQFFVVPLSIQKEGDVYVVGSTELGEFYQFPEQGLRILDMLKTGNTPVAIKDRLSAENGEIVDVDGFVDQLASIGFIQSEDQRRDQAQQLSATIQDSRRTFDVDPRIARAIFSWPVLLCYAAIVAYAIHGAITEPALRLNPAAFYIETCRTPLLLILLCLSSVQVVLHELGHMLAAARQGIKSKYGLGNRLWNIVAESDITGILTLPKSKRYFPMMAGVLVDIFTISATTILIQYLLQHKASPFVIQVCQAVVLENVIAIAWQFNIFVKTDVYYIICNCLSYPDLDKDAQDYLRDILHRITLGRLGARANYASFRHLPVIIGFSMIWLFGRVLSLAVLFGVFLPTTCRYVTSTIHLINTPNASLWVACDTIAYVTIVLTMMGIGMYMWLTQK